MWEGISVPQFAHKTMPPLLRLINDASWKDLTWEGLMRDSSLIFQDLVVTNKLNWAFFHSILWTVHGNVLISFYLVTDEATHQISNYYAEVVRFLAQFERISKYPMPPHQKWPPSVHNLSQNTKFDLQGSFKSNRLEDYTMIILDIPLGFFQIAVRSLLHYPVKNEIRGL